MNKTTLLTGLVIVGCIATLIVSYTVYNSRIESLAIQTGYAPIKSSEKEDSPKKKQSSETETESPDTQEQSETTSLTAEQIESITANMSEEVSSVVSSRLQAGEIIDLLIIGSSSIEGSPGYGDILTANLAETYGEWIETTTVSYSENTETLVNDLDGTLVDWSNDYDIVLLEGMNLSNNGEVVVEDSIIHIETINAKVKQNVTDAVLVVHPSQPLASAVYYPAEVDAFKMYLTNQGFTYIDHWADWPVGSQDEMNTYLTQESTPNEQGAALWASSLSTFFTGN
ncbi:hypothetical protein [Paenisporosarcina sp. TG20]|uniref:SGNH/GDSL hydrolase family protein n=1 Tax=Paenisporosarcina sp. TG20 TaxID=1211706 RepID=UPI0002DD6E50|nr:hypothetical protein [Paenisporosarcina sp. TG20]